MVAKLSSIEVKRQNKKRILRYLLFKEKTTKPEVAKALQLSIPTVGQIIGEFMDAGMVHEAGMQPSTGGRRAKELCINENYRYAAGIDVTKNHVEIALVNLRGDIISTLRQKRKFENSEEYREELRKSYRRFLEELQVEPEMLIGLGVSLPGIIGTNQTCLQRSHILELDEPMYFAGIHELSYPVRFFNYATAGCMAECYTHTAPEDFIFLSLSNSVGGAVVFHNEIVTGENGRNGEFGHICIVPGGRTCYCGKQGHYDPYGSALILAEQADDSVKKFFEYLGRDHQLETVLEDYLEHLALLIYNLHISLDYPVVIGGYVGSYLKPYLPRLKKIMEKYNIFEDGEDYIYTSQYNVEAAAVGSARYFVEQFIEELM